MRRRYGGHALGILTVGLLTVALIAAGGDRAGADGTEILGAPSVPVADGDGLVGGGVGLFGTEPGSADPGGSRAATIAVPAGATVQQVLVYWEGQSTAPGGSEDTILVDGAAVTGQLIGGPTLIGDVYTHTYRADVTALALLTPGSNTVMLGGLEFDRKNSGAGIAAVIDSGAAATVDFRDGNDFAYQPRDAPLDTTTPLVVDFPTVAEDTVASPLLFVSSVDDERPRSSVIRFTFDTGDVVEFGNQLTNNNGDEWDTFDEPLAVPAGASSVTMQILSELPAGDPGGPQPASLVWNLAAISIPQPAQVGGLRVVKTLSGATEGYAAGTTFAVDVDCDGTEFDATLDLEPGGAAGSVAGIPPGTACTVTETGVPDAAPGFAYQPPTYSPGQEVVIGTDAEVEVVIDNPLTPLGMLEVRKTLSGSTAGYDPATTFTVLVDCDGDDFDTALELTPDAAPGTVGPMPDGTTCTVTETDVPPALPDFAYAPPVYEPDQTVTVSSGSNITVTVDNPLEELTMMVALSAQCINDTPYVDYDVTLGPLLEAPDGATVRFVSTATGETVEERTRQPLSGRLLWPGAEVDESGEPVDWPGWELVGGEWVEVDDGLRPAIDVNVEINPEQTQRVDYPPPLPTCNANPPTPPDTPPGRRIPDTGAESVDMSLAGLILMTLGGALTVVGQIGRRRSAERA